MKKEQHEINPTDEPVLEHIREIIHRRPSYGYRRVTAIMNAQRSVLDMGNIKHKRVYRIMQGNDLLLSRYANRPLRVHDGKIMTLHSNTRWCSDGFHITCDNGDRVQVAFSLDTCDREAMGYIASNKGVDGGMIRDLMTETMLYRFGEVNQLPHKIQWLTDNGPCYVARMKK